MSTLPNFTSKSLSTLTPSSILGLDFWLDATDTTTIQSSGTSVTSWTNKGSQSFSATPSLGTPTTGTTWNGLNYIECPIGARLSFASEFRSAADQTWFVVARGRNQVTTPSNICIFMRNAANDYFALRRSTTATSSGVFQIVLARANTFLIQTQPGDPVVRDPRAGDPFGTVMSYCAVNDASYPTISNVANVCGGASLSLLTNSTASGYTTASSTYTIGDTNNNMGWDFFEIMRFSRSLPEEERLGIEGYIAWKYRMRTKDEETFIPTSISNCVLWLDSGGNREALGGGANTSNWVINASSRVTKWIDKSGNGNDASLSQGSGPTVDYTTQHTEVSSSWSDGYALNFQGNNALYCPLTLASNAAVTVFAVTRPFNRDNRCVFSLNSYPGTRGSQLSLYSGGRWHLGGSTTDTCGNPNAIAPAISTTTRFPYVISGYWSPGSSQLFCQGAGMPASSLAPASLRANSAAIIGANTTATANSTTYGQFLTGNIYEIIVYNQTLTENNRKLVENYLGNKWSSQLASTTQFNHPFRTSIPQQRPFTPADITNSQIIFWIDAADPARFTVTNSNVTAITDKALVPSTLTIGGTVGYDTTTLNGLPSFNLSNGRIIADVLATSIRGTASEYRATAIFVGYLFNNPAANTRPAISTNSTNTNPGGARWRVSEYNTTSTRNVWTNSSSQTVSIAPAVATGTPYIWAGGIGQLSGSTYRYMGYLNDGSGANFTTTNSSMASIATQTHLRVGGDVSIGLTSNTYPGCIGEVIVFNSLLSLSELRLVSGYLAAKWNLAGSYSQFSYYKSQNGGAATANLDPTGIGNSTLKTWLDASDLYARGLTQSNNPAPGTSITSWMDKCDVSGNAGFRKVGGGTIAYELDNGYPAVYFNATAYFRSQYTQQLPVPEFTVAIVTRNASNPSPDDQFAIRGWRDTTATPDSQWSIRVGSASGRGVFNVTTNVSSSGGTFFTDADRSIYILGCAFTPIFRRNGTAFTPSATISTSTSVDLGRVYIGANYAENTSRLLSMMTGYIYEVVIYTSILSIPDCQRLEGYLAWKWGAQDKLPATHPFKRLAT